MTASKTTFVYVTYIRTTPEKLWQALTTPEFIRQYWFGSVAESDWTAGSPWRLLFDDGTVADTGEILEAVPGQRLVIKWRNEWKPELKAWFPEGQNDPDLCMIKVKTDEAHYWDSNNTRMVEMLKIAASVISGKKLSEGVHGDLLV